jgi:signal transduction histidine kinase
VGDHVHLVLEDNGTGPGTARTAGRSGWTNMRERAARLGGTLHIAPATPSGTRVELRFAATGITRSDDARSGANGHISP